LTGLDLRGQDITGANFGYTTHQGFTKEQLYSTASYQAKNLTGIGLTDNDLTGWDLSGQDLTHGNLNWSTLSGVDMTGAIVTGVGLNDTTSRGFTREQLYSTASYQARDLRGIGMGNNDLTGWNLRGQNLSNADLGEALTGADLTGADLRNVQSVFAGAITTNAILTDGEIQGLVISDGETLLIRDYDGGLRNPYLFEQIPIAVLETATIGAGGSLEVLFEADDWGSTISFAASILVQLGGALELTFADDVNLTTQVGRTLRIFDWTGVAPDGQFEIRSPYVWDVSHLYTTGDVTLVAVPEPSVASTVLMGVMIFATTFRASYRTQRR
jgi:uncharacterized protein YjbI with pentapeptide repeats